MEGQRNQRSGIAQRGMEEESLVLCDTNIIIELYKGNLEVIRELKAIGQHRICISTITVGELLFGAFNKAELHRIQKDIESLRIISLDAKISELFIHLMERYSLSHRPSLPDMLIAATAIQSGLPLYTLNRRDFQYLFELEIWQPSF